MATKTTTRTIVHNDKILGGEPILSGTRVPVRAVARMARTMQGDLASIHEALPTLSPADIRLALHYAQEHPDEIARWEQYDADADREPL